ncbi:rhomboid family intramembrane serine protease [Candidatus Scalindua japonica]|uniref:rhomboid family intramembrane serine protease n=1 Tax=Candidatus Scalindua japonica TaxID=1284222 RepID=UPI000BDE8D11|nr:rhomboid family intramembrane serine protease [Candidatus Scalindua japonica]
MIPIRDRNPSGTFPYITIGIIVINVFIFLYELSLGSDLNKFINQYGVVPIKITHYYRTSNSTLIETFFPFISSTFLHAGFIHLIGNMWFLWIFGDNIEDKLGHVKYLAFYILCGIIGSSFHVFFYSRSEIPCIGASGAIAAVLGAYMITFPRAKVITIVPIFFFIQIIELPAIIVLGFWLLIQFFNGTVSIMASRPDSGVAWWAHIGGFISGIVLFSIMRVLFVRKPVRRSY